MTQWSPDVQAGMACVLSMLRAAPDSILPDPKVAAIVVSPDGQQLAAYSKTRFGEPHSEAQVVLKAFELIVRRTRRRPAHVDDLLGAFRQRLYTPGGIKSKDDLSELRRLATVLKDPLKGSSLFVNLEPCSHFGKNPACAAVIAAAGVPTVHFAHFDPDPDVQGKGHQMLKSSGVRATVGCCAAEAMDLNKRFLQIASFLPRLFGGIHPTASAKEPPHVMLGLMVPRCEVRSKDLGKHIDIHTFGTAPKRTTIATLPRSGSPKLSPAAFARLPLDSDAVLFTTLLNPPAIVQMIKEKFQLRPGMIISAIPDMSFELGKEDCVAALRECLPKTHVCVGVRMAPIQDQLARISLRRRLMVERDTRGKVAIVVLAKGIPSDQERRVESRFVELVGATTLHVSRFEEYLTMLKFLRDDIAATIYIGGDVFSERWRERTADTLRKLMLQRPRFALRCTEEEAVAGLKAAGVARIEYLEPYWEVV